MKIHKSELPKKLKLDYDSEGFIHGDMIFLKTDNEFVFQEGNKIHLQGTKPIITVSTHIMMRFISGLYVGIDKHGKYILELCEFTMLFK